MKNKNFLVTTVVGLTMIISSGCTKDLDRFPTNANTSETQYNTPEGYKQVLAKVYGSYSLISSQGTGNSDVVIPGLGGDQAPTDYIRGTFNLQELTTDEDVCAWNDPNIQSLHNFSWTSSNPLIEALYKRSLFQITVCNEFIRESSDDKISSHGFAAKDAADIKRFRAEARFIRAYQYWVLMDMFGNPPFVTEADPIGKFIPKQISRADVFKYVESELKAIDGDLVAPMQNEYGRADQAAAWALLARMYLNAAIYTGTPHWDDAITYASKVINAGYSLKPHFADLFKSDNNLNNPEQILSIAYDAVNSQDYGGTTFLICSAHGTDPTDNKQFGIPSGGWLGNRTTKNLPLAFGDYSGNNDKRAMFGAGGLEISSEITFNDGLQVHKFSNQSSTGATPYSPNGVLVSTDFPLFRLGEMYLIYIEAAKRGGNGDAATALQYFNLLRERAYENNSGDVTTYTLDDILSERQRELYWECCRRTDLIRFGEFTTGTYLWPWKGGIENGTGVDAHFNLFPIPSSDIITNPNLTQNPGY